ncbi:DUF5320 family protein [Caldicellulosiruptor morganii]|uniref:DUF5320 family protein n=1 Tax=Caldicellulosiruptor morganii TaxID=1387555 RepID=A0ABY7BN84_9FIRM|nr:DUF5320 family protein [Caldicellulosiruptor morganii]WAM34034.1 DUF5320 family protein [Caldicellulosiruptor morganii]
MPWGFGPAWAGRGFARGSGRGFGGGYGRGLGVCKWLYFNQSSDVPFAKEALEYEKQVLEQRLKLIDKLLSNDQKQE